jgi:hypothetical protein
VPRSLDDLIASADHLAQRLEEYEPQPGDRDKVSPMTTLKLAALRRAAAERDLADAVRAARADGASWSSIGAAVGTSGEAARQRYGRQASAGAAAPSSS